MSVILLQLLLSTIVFADTSDFEKKAANLDARLKLFQEICLTESGEVSPYAFKDGTGDTIDCPTEALNLSKQLEDVQKEATMLSGGAVSDDCPYVVLPTGQILDLTGTVGSALGNEKPGCPANQQTPILSTKCVSELACNSMRAWFGQILGPIYYGGAALSAEIEKRFIQGKPENESFLRQCFSPNGKSDCFTEMIKGVFDSLWSNIEMIWTGVKWVGKKIANAWRSFWGVEDATSEAALQASQQSEAAIKRFKADPIGFVKDMLGKFVDMIGDAIKKDFGCEQWSGLPHVSTCLKPLSSWDCANCSQKMNMVCGVGGYIIGEVVTAWLTGGATAAGKAGGKIVIEAATKLSSAAYKTVAEIVIKAAPKVAEFGSKVKYLAEGFKTTAITLGKLAGSNVAKILTAIAESKAAQKVMEFSEKASSAGEKVLAFATETKVYKATATTVKIATYPVRKYAELLEEAYKLGFKQVESGVTRKTAKGMEVVGKTEELSEPAFVGLSDDEIEGVVGGLKPMSKEEQVAAARKSFNDITNAAFEEGDLAKKLEMADLKLDEAKKLLDAHGVKYDVIEHEIFDPVKKQKVKSEMLVIKPEAGASKLNDMAAGVCRNMGGYQICYDPKRLAATGAGGLFNGTEGRVFISDGAIRTAKVDGVTLHELNHAGQTIKWRKGEDSLFTGSIYSTNGKPFATNTKLYQKYMSLQEVETYATQTASAPNLSKLIQEQGLSSKEIMGFSKKGDLIKLGDDGKWYRAATEMYDIKMTKAAAEGGEKIARQSSELTKKALKAAEKPDNLDFVSSILQADGKFLKADKKVVWANVDLGGAKYSVPLMRSEELALFERMEAALKDASKAADAAEAEIQLMAALRKRLTSLKDMTDEMAKEYADIQSLAGKVKDQKSLERFMAARTKPASTAAKYNADYLAGE